MLLCRGRPCHESRVGIIPLIDRDSGCPRPSVAAGVVDGTRSMCLAVIVRLARCR
jgi:hypothetical protein